MNFLEKASGLFQNDDGGDKGAVGDIVDAVVDVVKDKITSGGDGGNDEDKGVGELLSGFAGDVTKQAAENKAKDGLSDIMGGIFGNKK